MASAHSLLKSSVAELLERYPTTAAVFMQHRMACVGCAFAAFETIADAIAIYRFDRTSFVNELIKSS